MAGPALHAGLKQRHLTMIAIGGVIGAGLFVGSGASAGHRAGLIRHPVDFIVLWPRDPGP